MSTQIVEAQGPWLCEDVIVPQTVGLALKSNPEGGAKTGEAAFTSDTDFWVRARHDKIIPERTVRLSGFNISEWIPRNPGLYHTELATLSRNEAEEQIYRPSDSRYGVLAEGLDEKTIRLYTPVGKASMLRGGVGCVRFSPARVKKRGTYWYMGATSSGTPDQGIPLLMSNQNYQSVIDQIRERGSVSVDILGTARIISEEHQDLYGAAYGIPRLYIEVERLHKRDKQIGPLEVRVAASFLSEFEGEPKIYASYVTFRSGRSDDREHAVEWMYRRYIEKVHGGSVLTDFDQQAPEVDGTLFSLNQVLIASELVKRIAVLRDKIGYFHWDMLEKWALHFHEENIMVENTIHGPGKIVQAVGTGSSVTVTEIKDPHHVAPNPVPRAPAHMDAGKPVLFSIVGSALVLGVCFIGAGIWLVYLGATGGTQITLFGNTMQSQNVGIVSIFCGAVVVAVTLRRVMRTLVELGRIK